MTTTITAEHRQHIPRPLWMTARARNALRRPMLIGAVSVGTFVIALVAMVVMPQRSDRVASAMAPKASDWPDTSSVIAIADSARLRLAQADSALSIARNRAATLAQAPTVDTLNPALAARRDSLTTAVATLNKLLARVENSPLSASYRALAESPPLAGDVKVKALLDSLSEIERERESVGAVGGADPAFVALTARLTEIGRSIQTVAAAHRDDMTRMLAALVPATPPPSGAEVAAADTLQHIAQRDTAVSAYNAAMAQLARARQKAAMLQQQTDRAREVASTSAPALALLGAALVFGMVLGFGVALLNEVRLPRIADEPEAEWAAGVRVLARIRPRPPAPERARRSADRNAPPYIDPAADGHQLVYLTVATAGANLLMLTITGPEAPVSAVIAANFAAIAAEEARNVLLVDVDSDASAVAAALRIHAEPGFSDIVDGRVEWSEATVQITIGRDRTIDIVPSGSGPARKPTEIVSRLSSDSARLARHYDAIIIVSSIEQALAGIPGALPVGDSIYCAHVGTTSIRELRRGILGLRQAGGTPLGVVLWDAEPPVLLTPEEIAAAPRPMRTAEMPVARAGR